MSLRVNQLSSFGSVWKPELVLPEIWLYPATQVCYNVFLAAGSPTIDVAVYVVLTGSIVLYGHPDQSDGDGAGLYVPSDFSGSSTVEIQWLGELARVAGYGGLGGDGGRSTFGQGGGGGGGGGRWPGFPGVATGPDAKDGYFGTDFAGGGGGAKSTTPALPVVSRTNGGAGGPAIYVERNVTLRAFSGAWGAIFSGGGGGDGGTAISGLVTDGYAGGVPGSAAPVSGGIAGAAIVSNGKTVTKIGSFDIRGAET